MRMAPDDKFKLRFPVAKDRTLRRIAIAQLSIYMTALLSVAIFFLSAFLAQGINEFKHSTTNAEVKNIWDVAAVISAILFVLSFPASWIVAIIEARVQMRRYGWRAMKDPIEAQRRQQLQQVTNPVNIVTGIAQGTLGHVGARGWAGAAASP